MVFHFAKQNHKNCGGADTTTLGPKGRQTFEPSSPKGLSNLSAKGAVNLRARRARHFMEFLISSNDLISTSEMSFLNFSSCSATSGASFGNWGLIFFSACRVMRATT